MPRIDRVNEQIARLGKQVMMSQPLNATTEWVSIATVATHLGVRPATVRAWIGQGRLRAKRFGPKLIRIELASVRALGESVRDEYR
jgi:excisionase family DNA binding protein